MDTQAIAERGCDAEQVDAEFARECDRERRLGINFRRPGSPAQAPGGSDPDTDDGKVPQTGCAGFRPRPNRRCRPAGVIQMLHAQIAQRAFNTPLLVEPSKAMAFLSGLGSRITGRRLRMAGIEVTPEDMAHAAVPVRAVILTNGLAEQYQRDGQTPFALQDGIAVIEISGVPVHRGAWIGRSSGQTFLEGIATQLAAAAEDPAVRRIAVEIGSFGDEVAGVFDLADAIRAARGAKPVWALIAEHAFSAGYALASQADRTILPRTILPRTGAVGSIGVVVMHADPHSALIEIAKRALKAVICLTSALSFHQLTDQLPRRIWFAVGAKDWAPRIDYPQIRVVRFREPYLTNGLEVHTINGVDVRVYSITKSSADACINPRLVDRSVAIEAMKSALDDRKPSVQGEQAIAIVHFEILVVQVQKQTGRAALTLY